MSNAKKKKSIPLLRPPELALNTNKENTIDPNVPENQNNKSFKFEFLNNEQKEAWDLFQQPETQILFLIGGAGSGKTFLSVYFALDELKKGKRKMILTRPLIEAGEKVGTVPGSVVDKVEWALFPIQDAINKICGKNRKFLDDKIEIIPLAHLRGRNLENSVCLLDESQNCSDKQLIMYLTRLSKNSRMLITLDPMQSDLNTHSNIMNIIDKIKDLEGVKVMHFSDDSIVRHPLVAAIVKRLAPSPKKIINP